MTSIVGASDWVTNRGDTYLGNVSINNVNISTKVNKTGDTMSGALTINADLDVEDNLTALNETVTFVPYSLANPFARMYLYTANKGGYTRFQAGNIYSPGLFSFQSDDDLKFWAGAYASNSIIFGDSSTTTPMFMMGTRGTYAGRLGIGTQTPATDLEVHGGFRIQDEGTDLEVFDIFESGDVWYFQEDAGGTGTNNDINFRTKGNNSLKLGTNSQARIHIEGEGDVGIGTDDPLVKLHVVESNDPSFVPNGNSDYVIEDTNNGYALLELSADSNNVAGVMFRDELMTAGSVGGYIRYDHSTDLMRFDTFNNQQAFHIQSGDITAYNDIHLDATTNANQKGYITKGGLDWLHDFNYGDNGAVTTKGHNIFLGEYTGASTTAGSTATSADESSWNIGIGYAVMQNRVLGYQNVAIGNYNMRNINKGFQNVALGYSSGTNIYDGNYNMFLGSYSGDENINGSTNIAIGYASLKDNEDTDNNMAMGGNALRHVTGSVGYNVAVGYNAGRYYGGNSGNPLTVTDYSIYIGQGTDAKQNAVTREIVIGADQIGYGDNTVVLGTDFNTDSYLIGDLHIGNPDTTTDTDAQMTYYTNETNGTIIYEGDEMEFNFNANISTTGNVLFNARNEYELNPSSFKLPTSNPAGFGTVGAFSYLAFDDVTSESAYTTAHVPPNYKDGTDWEIEIYWTADSTDLDQVTWCMEYASARKDVGYINATTSIMCVNDTFSGDPYLLQEVGFGVINGTLAQSDDEFGFRLYRDTAQDNQTEDALMVEVAVYYDMDKIGDYN